MQCMEMKLKVASILLGFLVFAETSQEETVQRTFRSVNDVNIADNMNMSTTIQTISTQMRCSSLCIQKRCQCTSFLYDNIEKECHMFSRTLTTGNGSRVGYNKITECATPQEILNATLQNYTGCNASYSCNNGYTSSASNDSNVITCQTNETWTPSDYKCVQIPCPQPPSLTNRVSSVSSYNPGGVATYSCDINFSQSGEGETTLTCLPGGTWTGNIGITCIPAYRNYTITITTSSVGYAGTDAKVYAHLYCQRGNFKITFPASMTFEKSDVDVYQGTHNNIGDLVRVYIGHDNSGDSAGWKVESIQMEVRGDGQESYSWTVNQWIYSSSVELSA